MLELCLMLHIYAQNYAGIIGWSLSRSPSLFNLKIPVPLLPIPLIHVIIRTCKLQEDKVNCTGTYDT